MPVPDALCIIFACPVVTMVLSAVMLGDRLNIVKCFSGTVLLLGVVLVCQPPFIFPNLSSNDESIPFLLSSHGGLYYVGVALAAIACLTGGLMDVLIVKCEVCFCNFFYESLKMYYFPGSINPSSCQLCCCIRTDHYRQRLSSSARLPRSFF